MKASILFFLFFITSISFAQSIKLDGVITDSKSSGLEMANVMAIVANRGFYYKPHLVKAIGEKKIIKKEYTQKNYASIDAKYFDPVIEGMSRVVNAPNGTAYFSKILDIEICGKTGTVQNPHGADHSVFVAFAPRDNPKIAIAVVVENAGYGATWSAPIASLMIEKYLNDSISRPKYYTDRLLTANLLPGQKKPAPKISAKKDSTTAAKSVRKAVLPISTSKLKVKGNE